MKARKTYFAPLGSGIGDVVVALPILHWLAANGRTRGDDGEVLPYAEVFLVARGPRQMGFDDRIPCIRGTVREVDLASILTEEDRYINLRDHPLQRNYDWYSERFARDYPNFFVNDIMREVCATQEIFPDFNSFPKLSFNQRGAFRETVFLVPGATSNFKSWPCQPWLALIDALKAVGEPPVILGEPERNPIVRELVERGMAHLPTATIGDAIDVISSCKAVIAVDTGLMHIAVQQGVPTVAMFNDTHTYFRPAPNCQPLFAAKCDPRCMADFGDDPKFSADFTEWVWWDGVFDHCKAEKPCMTSITPDTVLAALRDVSERVAALTR